jgi:hypothetical protein
MGTVLSHDYVTSLYVNNSVAVPDGLKLYGNQKKCQEKGIEFKTRRRLLRYCVLKSLSSIEATVEWVRRKAMRLFIHKIRNIKLTNKSILRLIDTK